MDIATYVQARPPAHTDCQRTRRRRRQIGDGLMGMIAEPYLKVLRVTPLVIRVRGRLFV